MSLSLAHRDRVAIFVEHGKAASRPHAIAVEQFVELCAVRGKLRAIGFPMPEMEHAGGETPVLALHAAADHANDDVGILQPPADERCFKSIDTVNIGAEERE